MKVTGIHWACLVLAIPVMLIIPATLSAQVADQDALLADAHYFDNYLKREFSFTLKG